MTMPLDDDELTALYDAEIPRVDLVRGAASGVPRFLLAKQAADSAGLLDAGYVRDLIGKQTPPAPTPDGPVTMTGSPAAMAAFIHKAASKEPGVATVTKDIGPDLDGDPGADDGMDLTVPLAEPETDAPGDATAPGSPAWEAIDSATAQKWTAVAVRLKNALQVMADREMVEAATADPSDADNAFDLEDAMAAIDYAIGTLAGFAVDEQAESDLAAEAMDAIGKAMAQFDPGQAEVFEGLTAIAKAGRVLSSTNEARIRDAAASLQSVLASLPSAPTTTDSGLPVAKQEETAVAAATETVPAPPVPVPVAKADEATPAATLEPAAAGVIPVTTGTAADAAPVAKADAAPDGKPAMQAVFDQDGDLIGIVDPSAITPVAGAGSKADPEPEPAPVDDTAPQDPAAAGVPADAVTKAETPEDPATPDFVTTVTKSVTDALTSAFENQATTFKETIAKQATVIEGQAAQLEAVKKRVEEIAEQPAMPKVFTNGAVPPAGTLRGQDQGSVPVDVAKAAELKRTLYKGTAPEQNKAFADMQQMAIDQYAAIRGGRA